MPLTGNPIVVLPTAGLHQTFSDTALAGTVTNGALADHDRLAANSTAPLNLGPATPVSLGSSLFRPRAGSIDLFEETQRLLTHPSWAAEFRTPPALEPQHWAQLRIFSDYCLAHDLDFELILDDLLREPMWTRGDIAQRWYQMLYNPQDYEARSFVHLRNGGYRFDNEGWRLGFRQSPESGCTDPRVLKNTLRQIIPAADVVLDLMGGDGTFALDLLCAPERHNQVILVDGHGTNLASAALRARASAISPRQLQLIYQDTQNHLLLPDGCVDTVMLLGYPTHSIESGGFSLFKLYSEALRVLRPKGRLLLEFMHQEWVDDSQTDLEVVDELIECRQGVRCEKGEDGKLVIYHL